MEHIQAFWKKKRGIVAALIPCLPWYPQKRASEHALAQLDEHFLLHFAWMFAIELLALLDFTLLLYLDWKWREFFSPSELELALDEYICIICFFLSPDANCHSPQQLPSPPQEWRKFDMRSEYVCSVSAFYRGRVHSIWCTNGVYSMVLSTRPAGCVWCSCLFHFSDIFMSTDTYIIIRKA